MDVTQTISLSPRTKSRGNTNMLNGREVKNGFNMSNWQVECFENLVTNTDIFLTQMNVFIKFKIL